MADDIVERLRNEAKVEGWLGHDSRPEAADLIESWRDGLKTIHWMMGNREIPEPIINEVCEYIDGLLEKQDD